MSNSFYEYDEQSLELKKIHTGLKNKILNLIKFVFIAIVGSVITFVLFNETVHDKKTKRLLDQKEELLKNYQRLHADVTKIQNEIKNLQVKDDNLYRPILELNPLSDAVRTAGFGGVSRYDNMLHLSSGPFVINIFEEIDRISSQLHVQNESYKSVIKKAKEKEQKLDCKPGIQPISVSNLERVSDYFGWRRDPFTGYRKMHYGVDLAGPRGCSVFCAGAGTVTRAEYVRGYGNMVEIDHGYNYKTRYAHLDEISVEVGQQMKRGQVVGKLGNTGRSTGPHLHYEVRYNNRPVNPMDYYRNNLTASEYDHMIKQFSQ